MLRCAETTELMLRNINFPNSQVQIDDRLIEKGCDYDILEGLDKEQRKKIIPKSLNLLWDAVAQEPNPFARLELSKDFRRLRDETLPYSPTDTEAYNNYLDFLSDLSSRTYSRVLVVSHSQTMGAIIKIICGISSLNNWIKVDSFTNNTWMENCSMMCVKYHPDINTYELISAPEHI